MSEDVLSERDKRLTRLLMTLDEWRQASDANNTKRMLGALGAFGEVLDAYLERREQGWIR